MNSTTSWPSSAGTSATRYDRSSGAAANATEILRQALVIARGEGVERVLVTCDDGNSPSQHVIERCGGALEDVRLTDNGKRTRRYWIG